ncbi:helix-turn-helix transcriptional regulator [Methylobacter sp. S3L5C]|uniref:helix-turn-helix domain-containing protein n=1 Tax=Methylobacter sp. S3L5C TaxID=2839024 RepID=UPI001FAD7FB7|nr:helix-turn-helix transcriptional regulator [Methylobacter sp. S3L5C]UOA08581.1 helix-turn-helix domain-containing protein [Methylobacter sp. S3L5C]
MKTITRGKIKSTNKSPEIERLIEFLNSRNMKAADLAATIDSAERTITNHIWNDTPLGGQILRELLLVHGVSINWLVSGVGSMYVKDSQVREDDYANNKDEEDRYKPLMKHFDTTDLNTLQDFWWLTAKSIEQSLMQSGAEPGADYSRMDLYTLAQPFVLERFKTANMDVSVYGE